jgi:hypothetical protein
VSVQIRLVVSCGFRCDNLDRFFNYIPLSHYRKDSLKLSCEQPRVDYFDKQMTSYHSQLKMADSEKGEAANLVSLWNFRSDWKILLQLMYSKICDVRTQLFYQCSHEACTKSWHRIGQGNWLWQINDNLHT